ncbi:MAG TPA: alpha/beta hydrolase [Solirubrobacteraceae bacterium]|jgi:pimeloyl-ACP methyl ester carboxylesterase|nr:alpha/beta hydrolase [Solirubrobacteraceae bacterium]
MPTFEFEDQRIAYTEYGGGPAAVTPSGARGRTARSASAGGRPLILVHGLLLSQEMHRPLAEDLAARGNRVITVDLLGHGESDRPRDMWRYSMRFFGDQLVALMDHLGLDEAVVMGTSLGANTALNVALTAPERLRGMVIEMPVLDNALMWSALAFTPLLAALTFGESAMKLVSRVTRAVPRRLLPHYGNVMLDLLRQEPGPSGALLQGLFFGRIAPHRNDRRTFQTPTLVLGHHRDPVHPFSDAGMLVEEMPNARLLEANSMMELRMQPERLTNEIAGFLDEVWAGPRASAATGAKAAKSAPASKPRKRAAAKRAGASKPVARKAAKAPAKRAAAASTSR